MAANTLYYGDNLDILQQYVRDETIDLVYLDPPFKSNVDYNILFKEKAGVGAASQIKAFEDTWHWDQAAAKAYEEVVEKGGKLADAMRAFRTFLGTSDMLAYLSMMAPRLLALRDVLKPTGSIYLHCDPAASHYLKMLMDATFGPQNFRNEIVWRRTAAHGKSLRYAPIHDTILFYAKADARKWNHPRKPYMRKHVEQFLVRDAHGYRTNYYGNVLTGSGIRGGESGKPWRGFNPTAKGRHWAIPRSVLNEVEEDLSDLSQHEKLERLYELGYINIIPGQAWPTYEHRVDPSRGQAVGDIWAYQPYTEGTVFGTDDGIDADVRWLSPQDQERLGYPTQKPEGLLQRIIEASTDPGDLVLDPFCGCGTTVIVAQRLQRRWIGIDITYLAIDLIKRRLTDAFGPEIAKVYKEIGAPVTPEDARQLAHADPFQFQIWALHLVNAQGTRAPDRGIDGRLYFHDEPGAGGATKQIMFSVKAGKLKPEYVRELRGVIEREGAEIGVLITMETPTREMRKEAAAAGFYKSPWGQQYPRLQTLTVAELLSGKRIDYPPPTQTNVTFKKAPKARAAEPEQLGLVAEEESRYPRKPRRPKSN